MSRRRYLEEGSKMPVLCDPLETLARLEAPKDTSSFEDPVTCSFCSGLYDLAAVKPALVFQNCVVFYTPCCSRRADTLVRRDMEPPFVRERK